MGSGGDMTATQYEYHMIAELAKNLEKNNISKDIIERVMEGGEKIKKTATPQARAEWMKGAMIKLQKSLDVETCKTVREGCACCLGGKRDKLAKAIAQENETLEDRIKAANGTNNVFGHSVEMMKDGKVKVQFFPEGLESYHCPCNSKAHMTMPIAYCYCCGGHVKHHLQNALGRKLDCTTVHTARSTGGKKPCTFTFEILD
jgi:hypothetical protein